MAEKRGGDPEQRPQSLVSLLRLGRKPPSKPELPAPPVDIVHDVTIPFELRWQIGIWRRRKAVLEGLLLFPLAIVVFLGSIYWPTLAVLATGHGRLDEIRKGGLSEYARGDRPLLILFLVCLTGLLPICGIALWKATLRLRRLLAEAEKQRQSPGGGKA